MHIRKKLIGTLLGVLLLVAAAAPLTHLLTGTLAAQQAADQRLLDMHVRHAAHEAEPSGSAVLPMIDIEDAWAIEDTRTESETPLVTVMHNGADELGFDAASGTFYCSLGAGLEDWPQLSLTAKGADGVQVAWIDDYTYDWCSDAVAEGYSYELIAYTEEAYSYMYVVFTGLPIVTLHTDEAIGQEYIPCCTTVSGGGYAAIDSASLTKERGGGFFKGIDKQSYRVEFHTLSAGGKDQKADVSVLGLDADTDWLLICNAGDETCMSNYLAWDMWQMWHEGGHTITPLDSRMVELFIQDEYMGLYQLMPRIQADAELAAMGGDLNTDVSARLIGLRYGVSRPLWEGSAPMGGHLELRYAPAWMSSEKAFSLYEPYVAMSLPEGAQGYLSDEEFTAMAEKYVDVRSFMSYYLYLQVCSLPLDNVHNNLYIWAVHDGEGGYTYRLSPWDMDSGFKPIFTDETLDFNLWMELPKRMLTLNVAGCREVLWEIWQEKRATILTDDLLYQWFLALEEDINATGAYLRESERWRGGASPLDLGAMSAYTIEHMGVIERVMFDTWPLDGQLAQ